MNELPAQSEPERFQVLSRLGRGGMGTVYAVFDRVRGARMALKTVGPAAGRALLRFKREFRAIRELHHPSIVRLGELIELHGEWHYTMELIDGVDFVSYVRSPEKQGVLPSALTRSSAGSQGSFESHVGGAEVKTHLGPDEEARLRHALAQLVDALRFLHARGRVHRDIKPSNVLVTREGRVVVLDFGLVRDASESADERDAAGTVAYMAPEQADHKPAAPEADFYALGVMLYEALTGTLPFVGEPIQVLMQKSQNSFRLPNEVVSDLPKDLTSLCTRLLSAEPATRPSGAEIAEVLSHTSETKSVSQSPLPPPAAFAGRRDLCNVLETAFAEVRRKQLRTVLIKAPSGLGKTALLNHFLGQISNANAGQILVLRGRCRPYEEVSFNALDSVVDALSFAMPAFEKLKTALSREQLAALQRAFPVLERVPGFAYVDVRRADARQLRLALYEGFRRLIRLLATTRHVVIAIDDVQWADDESWGLLRELTREPQPPSVLIVMTARPEVGERMTANADAARVLGGRATVVLDLPPLDDDEARMLVQSRGGPEAAHMSIDALIREGRGNPLLLTTLLRRPRADAHTLRLSEVLRAEVEAQPELTRHVVTATCLAASPPDRLLLARALSEDPAEVGYAVDAAIDSGLLRFAGTGAKGTIEPYHDQLREAVCSALDLKEKRALHLSLARVLSEEREAEEQALYHYREAGDGAAVRVCAERAGDRAMKALAFDRALRLFEEALHAVKAEPRSRTLERKRADALSFAGRSQEAAHGYLELVEGANAPESLELRRLAAAHFLSVGEVEQGKKILSQVLADFGLSLPRSIAVTLLRALWLRTRLRMRGMRVVLDGEKKPDVLTLEKLELCASCAYMFSVLDPILGTYFSTQHAVLALSAGDFEHALRAISTEGGYRCLMGNTADGQNLMNRASEIASGNASPRLKATLSANEAAIAWARSDFPRALRTARQAQRVFATQCQRVSWELVTLELVEVSSLFFLGQYLELAHRVPTCLRASEQRGDRYGMANMLVSQASVRFLAVNQPEAAREALTQGMSTWRSDGFDMHHLMALQLRIYCCLYENDREQALASFHEAERALQRSLLLRLTAYRVLARYIECQALLARGAAACTSSERRRATKITRELLKLDAPLGRALGSCAKLALEWSGLENPEAQTAALTRTIGELEAQHLEGHAAALRLRASECASLPSAEREGYASAAMGRLLAQGVVDPQRFIAILCPPLVTHTLARSRA